MGQDKILHLAMYLSELSLLHGETFLKYHPSMIAAASLALSRHALGAECHVEVTWPESLIELTGYTCETLKECLVSLHGARLWTVPSKPSETSTGAQSIIKYQISSP